jgi:hypothetical protein
MPVLKHIPRQSFQKSRKSPGSDTRTRTRTRRGTETPRGGVGATSVGRRVSGGVAVAGRRSSVGDARDDVVRVGARNASQSVFVPGKGGGASAGAAAKALSSTRPGAYREMLNGGGDGVAHQHHNNSTIPPGTGARGAAAGRRAGLPPARAESGNLELPSISGFGKQQQLHNVPTPEAPGQGLAAPAQTALNDRLAKLKQRLGKRQTEEGSQMPGLPPGGLGGLRGKPSSAGDDRLASSPNAVDDFGRRS